MSESLTDFVQSSSEEREVINIKEFIKYLSLYTCNCLLNDAENEARENYELFLSEPENKEYLYKFISDPQISTLIIRQIKKEEDNESDADFYFQLSNEIVLDLNKSQTLIFIKTTQIIEAAKLISSQIQVVNYSTGSPFESMHALVHHGLLPFYKSYIKMINKDNKTLNEKMITNVERRIIDLEIGLLNLKQNTEIPEIILTTHPYILKVIQEKVSENRIAKVSDFEDKFEDSQFLNQLQAGVMRWIKEIQKVTKLHRDPNSGTTLQEITFWLNFEQSLIRIQGKRESLEVSLTLGILKQTKRFHATKSFDTDTALCDAINTARNYNQLMKDFPINNLLSANNLEELNKALQNIFTHLKKITTTEYPVNKTIELMEALSRDLTTQIMEIISAKRLMDIPFDEFESIINNCQKVFVTWEDELDKIQCFLREIAKKRWEGFAKFAWRMNATHKKLQIRLENIKRFRHQHEELRKVVIRVLKLTSKIDSVSEQFSEVKKVIVVLPKEFDGSSIHKIDVAYEIVNSIDYLDFIKGESSEWDPAVRRYEEKIDRIESQIASNLRDLLGKSKNANEMFRYFSRFNALLVRPHIRGAVVEYQSQLIQRIKEDIESLQTKFKTHYTNSTVYKMSTIRNFPPVSGTIIWMRQILNQLNNYLRKVESVLGKDWDQHIEGQRLKVVGETFKAKLNADELFRVWLESVSIKSLAISGSVFIVEKKFLSAIQDNPASKKSLLKLKVNFNPEIITLSKEVRHMKDLGFPVPFSIVSKANTAKEMYPFAISLIDNIKTYEFVLRKIEEHKIHNLSILTSGLHFEVQRLINKGIKATWKHKKLGIYIQAFSELVFNFQDKVEDLIQTVTEIYINVYALETCIYSNKSFQELLLNIQKGVDNINFHQFSNLPQWVSLLEESIETKLVMRLEAGLVQWTRAFRGKSQEVNINDHNEDSFNQVKMGGCPKIKDIILELKITNHKLELIPSIEHATHELLQKLSSCQDVILDLPRIVHSRYQVGLQIDSASNKTYKGLLSKLGHSGQSLDEAYVAIFQTIRDTEEFIKQWRNYMSLWDLQSDQLISQISDNLIVWINVLNEIKKLKRHFDVTETRKTIGPLIIVFGKVRSKVSMKYDSWHKEILTKFGSSLGKMMNSLYNDMRLARNELEKQSLDLGGTNDCVNFIIYTQNIIRKANVWERQTEICRDGQNLLFRDRFQFPSNWIDSENIKGEWNAFKDIIKRKQEMISIKMTSLQMKVIEEDKIIEFKTSEILNTWEKEKPIAGDLIPKEAVKIINILESKILQLIEEREHIQKAKEALELTEHGTKPYSEAKIMNAYGELIDLKKVWSELKLIWEKIEEMKEIPWISVQPRKLRQDIDNLLVQMKHFPNSFSLYASHVHVRSLLKFYLKSNSSIVELKSEAFKERHWRMLMKKLDVNWSFNELQLGNIWDIVSVKNEGIIREVLAISQGERAIEEYLRQISEIWKAFTLELTNYQNKTMIIKGWDDLFNTVKEHVNNVASMKASPYFKEFEEEANSWEDRFNKINSVFDVWIDVQRRWIYLDGIFTGSADIKVLLPMESQRFQNVSTEVLGLMRKVQISPLVTDVLNIPNIQKQLVRLADLLGKIQRSLGEYLERQRASFPRFYFIGDEDLLEVIGNSKDLKKLQKHFKKMFTGVHSIILCENEKVILGMVSKEGEELRFLSPISITENVRINEWLTAIEKEMRNSLAKYLAIAVKEIETWKIESGCDRDRFMIWLDKYQAQVVNLAVQISWSESVEESFSSGNSLEASINIVHNILNMLADTVLYEQPPIRRQKLEHLIIEFVHQRDVLRNLHQMGVDNNNNFHWLSQMRFYFDRKQKNPLKQLNIHIANAKFNYGFEYLGIYDRLVQTPLTDRCYLTMTQALEAKLGGSPFGPAGTGKTESVKSLGHQLGRFVLVFNCDETFDFQAMGRIFVGLCQVGAWGCFDEFNRLEERMLSAVSQQIQEIQEALRELMISKKEVVNVELLGKKVYVNPDMAIFITMNPGYAGRSNLPDNLKKLFRSLAMTQPDRQLIAQVMLYSQGFQQAETLARKVVPFFKLCEEQLSSQPHYDFGLRALKSVLISSGNVKREKIKEIKLIMLAEDEETNETFVSNELVEQEILIQSIMETMAPKLIADDIPLLHSLLSDVFPGVDYKSASMTELREEIRKVSIKKHLVCSNMPNYPGFLWTEKVLQLYQIINIHHGLMMVGPSGSGKTMACQVLLEALENVDGIKGVAHIIDPKSINKDSLYGSMDPNTREWTDGLFTHILRKIIDNVRGEGNKRQWIIFDGDVDPEWVENLNSVLDDNKLLTLPNGERLGIPSNVRIMFEVQDLKYATLATVSRCGMVWFSEEVLTTEMILTHFLKTLPHRHLIEGDEMSALITKNSIERTPKISKTTDDELFNQVVVILTPYFARNGLIVKCLEYSTNLEHIMDFTRLRALTSLFSMIKRSIQNVIEYNQTHIDFPLQKEQVENYITKSLFSSIVWSMTGDSKLKFREQLSLYIKECSLTDTSNAIGSIKNIIDFEVSIQGVWIPLSTRVPDIEIEEHKITATDVVVPTIDTVRHETLLYTWLAEHRPVILCGPPGSGKTMTLFSALRRLPDMEVVGLNFSSATTPELMLKTFDQYCEYRKTPNGTVLVPQQMNKWLIFFCDEINLPDMDKYGTQRIISFLRQMVEYQGFYRISDMQWIHFERIQFVGACNPPTDPGRKPLSQRFLRHVPIIYVDYPGEESLKQIYSTFNRAMLRILPQLLGYSDTLTNAMVEFFLKTQERFTQDMQPHYIYSPREMTRWVRGIYEVLRSLETHCLEDLVRIWAHEALRLFQDRLVTDEERNWTDDNVNEIAVKYFPTINKIETLKRPILYSNWLNRNYIPVSQEELRKFVKARLKLFYEEELDVPLVLFNQVLDHVLRIDRVFRQSQGHLLLIGVSGAGKTTLSKFVAWINGLKVFQVKVHKKYSSQNFDDDLRTVLKRSGCKGEKIAFIMDESNVKDSSFLERMNTLLANGEVPGLFEGDEYMTLMTQCKEGALHEGFMIDSNEELYKWFTQQICKNLHVIFTMNPSIDGLKNKACTSPALFNRCVLNWFGDWSPEAYFQVGKEFTDKLDLEKSGYVCPKSLSFVTETLLPPTPKYRDVIVNSLVFVHQTMHQANLRVFKKEGKLVAITPRHFLDLISQFIKLSGEKRTDLEEQQLHLKNGLKKIEQTVQEIEIMQKSLTIKRQELENMNEAANMKLKQMVQDQQEAEQKKSTSHMLKKELTEQELYVNEKQKAVKLELDQVEPVVNEAKQAVRNIHKKDILEIRTMKNPPNAVKMAVESICLLLGEKTPDWQSILKVIIRDNFVQNVLNFNTDDITDGIRDNLKKYVSNPDFTFEKVNKASNACGPMVKWVLAQISYAGILRRVEPLRNELNELSNAAKLNMDKLKETENIISDLEEKIRKYTEEYAVLISQGQIIKSDLSTVEKKVNRSIALLHSLGAERSRWDNASESFKSQMAMINGDCLLSSAFITYGGYFDQQMRTNLFSTWCHNLLGSGILYRSDLSYAEYLSSPDDRLRWQINSLPDDNLCVENAIILSRFNRYPLIIDPSDQAVTYLMNEYNNRNIAKTSFLDDSFRKTLESSLRFGTPLLVQDVESYDPILNPILNREVRRTGGRTLITLGDQDVDLSPTFKIFLSTRDPSVEFSSDICSRVTFVNFAVTRSSLQTQCLNAVLKVERPDINQKRLDLLKIQGEFHLKLRHLEKDLLQSLNESQGNLLENDIIITRLETLKFEAEHVAKKVKETDFIMLEVENVSSEYMSLAHSFSSIYFTLQSLNQIHYLYHYSLQFMLDIFSFVLTRNPELNKSKLPSERLKIITKDLFQITYNRVARGMLHSDQITFAMILARIYLKGLAPVGFLESEFQHFMGRQETANLRSSQFETDDYGVDLDQQQINALERLKKLKVFQKVGIKFKVLKDIQNWITSVNPETNVPEVWDTKMMNTNNDNENLNDIAISMTKLLIIQAIRPDRLLNSLQNFISSVFGEYFSESVRKTLDLENIVKYETTSSIPILLCAVQGYDPSSRVEDLALEEGKPLSSIAIGSIEGFSQAEKAINTAVKSGGWVLFKNVHLAFSWLTSLEKKIHSLSAHPNFRLFLAMEIIPKLPVNLLRAGRILVFEPPPGIKANLLRTFSSIPERRMSKDPIERSRLYFMLAWFNAVVQERLRYVPLGYSKKYEFNESDFKCALDTVDNWVDATAMGRTNLPFERIPWNALQTLLGSCIYGGKIDNVFDQKLLDTFLKYLFSENCFRPEFSLISETNGKTKITFPEFTKYSDILQWINNLPDSQTPSWIDLPNSAERVLLINLGNSLIGNILKLHQALEDDEEIMVDQNKSQLKVRQGNGQPIWMHQLFQSTQEWLLLLPRSIVPLRRTTDNIKDPIYRCYEREIILGCKLLIEVRKDLEDIAEIYNALKKPTNHHRSIMTDLAKRIIPKSWIKYNIPTELTVIQWINDFSNRVNQLIRISNIAINQGIQSFPTVEVWLGGLFMPEAYITAIRQSVAQSNKWALEELFLDVELGEGEIDRNTFVITGLKLMGCEMVDSKTLKLSTLIHSDLDTCLLKWIRMKNDAIKEKHIENKVCLPVYLNAARSTILFTLYFHTSDSSYRFCKNGVAILSSPLGG